jgi:hypothetical protein
MSTVRKGKEDTTRATAPIARPHHRILSLTIEGGYLHGTTFEFVDDLNCMIGARGAGKTTVLEFLRYGLGLMPEGKLGSPRARMLEAHVQANLGGGTLCIEIVTKHGVRYTAKRSWKQPLLVFTASGEPAEVPLDRDLIFKADVYSQNEIEDIALNLDSQLALIDKFADEEMREIETKRRRVMRELAENASALLNSGKELEELRESAAEVPALQERLKEFVDTSSPNAQHLNTAHANRTLRDQERKAIEILQNDVTRFSVDLGQFISNGVARFNSKIDAEIGDGPNHDVFEPVIGELRALESLLKRGLERIAG